MKKTVQMVYLAALLFTVLLQCYIAFAFSLSLKNQRTGGGYETVEQCTAESVEDDGAPMGVRQRYTWTVEGVAADYRTLMFYSRHQNVEVYLDEECVYSMRPDRENLFGSTPGCVWNQLKFLDEDNGKTLKIELIPVYKSAIDAVPDFYFGSKYDISADLLRKDFWTIFFAIATIVIGFVFIGYTIYNRNNSEIDRSLAMLGIFAIHLGAWKFADTETVKALLPLHPVISSIPFFALLMASVPFALFIKEHYQNGESPVWYIPCFSSLIEIAAVLILQLAGVADLRQTLFLTHIQMVFLMGVCFCMTVRELRSTGWNVRLKRTVLCMGFCFAGFGLDLLIFYVTGGKTVGVLGMLGFLIYIVVLGVASIREAKQLMAIGMRAKSFERMAYHDQLTGLYNRTAYAAFVDNPEFDPDHCIVVVFDLNDLKKCNDTLGHEKGDLYIKSSAEIIRNIFGEEGDCYRMGGDEFCVLLKNSTLKKCKLLVGRLKEQVDRFNASGQGVFMQIACGYESYDRRIDYNIDDTARRADKMMYNEKFSMKQKNGGGEIR